MRIAIGKDFRPQAHFAEQLARQHARSHIGHAVDFRAERDRFLYRQARIERSIAVLKYHLHAAAKLAKRQSAPDLQAVIDNIPGITLHQVH